MHESLTSGAGATVAARRRFLSIAARCLAWTMTLTAGMGTTLRAWAGARNDAAFEAKTLDAALAAAGVADAIETDQIRLQAPELAENAALVHMEIESAIPGTESILVFAEKNPQPFVAQFDILPGMDPFVAVRIKMNESAFLRVVVRAGGKAFFVRHETKVTEGGCAG